MYYLVFASTSQKSRLVSDADFGFLPTWGSSAFLTSWMYPLTNASPVRSSAKIVLSSFSPDKEEGITLAVFGMYSMAFEYLEKPHEHPTQYHDTPAKYAINYRNHDYRLIEPAHSKLLSSAWFKAACVLWCFFSTFFRRYMHWWELTIKQSPKWGCCTPIPAASIVFWIEQGAGGNLGQSYWNSTLILSP